MSALRDGIELAKALEGESINTYEIYQTITEHPDLHRMLQALIEGGLARVQDLERFESRFDPERITDVTKLAGLHIDDLRIAQVFDAGIEYTDFLELICERERDTAVLYDRLAAVVADREPQYALKRLAEDTRRRLWLVRSRLELERL